MATASMSNPGVTTRLDEPTPLINDSAVSWPAIFAGGATALATSLLLVTLAAGLGLSSVSPWPNSGVSATTFTVTTAIYLIVVQWLSAGLGGYMAGRLRTKWVGVHTDEVFFRDTAHGLLAWAAATIFAVGLIGSMAVSATGTGVRALTSVTSGAAQGATQGAAQGAAQSASPLDPSGYFVDSMFRSSTPDTSASAADSRAEATRILAMSARNGSLAPADRTYLAQMVVARTGISQQDAEKRIDDVTAQAKSLEDKERATADETRKATAKLSFYLFFSMLIGAFIASVSGAIGGRLRDSF